MKVLSSIQIREADKYTIENEPIVSIDLMERASQALVTKFLGLHPEKQQVYIFCGTGNNGGDGLAIARLLRDIDWEVEVYIVGDTEKGSEDFKLNLKRLQSYKTIASPRDFPEVSSNAVIIDGLFGSGLTRPVEGLYAELILFLNNQKAQRIAIDIASGLYADQPRPENAAVFEPDFTISFQVPKLVFFLPECEKYVGKWRVLDIGLDKGFIEKTETPYLLSEAEELHELIPIRTTFAHKSQVGRLMIVAGSKGKMGAAVLCARAAFRSGAGLVNVHTASCGMDILQISIPEAMVSVDDRQDCIATIPDSQDTFALGPGLGTDQKTVEALSAFFRNHSHPVVVDADAINILAENKDILDLLPKGSVLTPHPGEFKRLVGSWKDDFEKLEKLRKFCSDYQLNVVLKGAFSAVCNDAGKIYFNPSGNPGLATAGSGDVLTGIAGALLAQGLSPFEALRLAVYLHGLAGDEAVRKVQTPWIQASDIIDHIPEALSSLLNH